MNFLEAYLQLNNLIEDITGKEKYSEDDIISYSCESIYYLVKILMSGQIGASNVFEYDAQSDNNVILDPYVSFSKYWYNQAVKNPSKGSYILLFNFNKLAETSNKGTARGAFDYVAPKNVNIQEVCYLKDSNEFIIVTNCGCFLIPPELAEPIIKAFIGKFYTREDKIGDAAANLYKRKADYEAALLEYEKKLRKGNKGLQDELEELAKNDTSSKAAYYKDGEKQALNKKERDREKGLRNQGIDLAKLKAKAEEEAKGKLIDKRVYPPTPPTKIPEDEIQKFEKQREAIKNLIPIFHEIDLPEEEKVSSIFNTLNNLLVSKSPINSYRFQGDAYSYNLDKSDLERIDSGAYSDLINYLNKYTAFEEGEVRYGCDKTPTIKKSFDIITKEELKSDLKGFVCPFESKAVCGIILPEQLIEPFATRCAFKLKEAYPDASSDLIEKCTGIKFIANEDITSRDQALKFLQDNENSGDPLNWLADGCVTNGGTNYELYGKGIDGHNAIMDLQFFKTVDPNYNKAINKGGIRGKAKTKKDA